MEREKHELELTKIAQEMHQNVVKHKQTMEILALKERILQRQLDTKTNLHVHSQSDSIKSTELAHCLPELQIKEESA